MRSAEGGNPNRPIFWHRDVLQWIKKICSRRVAAGLRACRQLRVEDGRQRRLPLRRRICRARSPNPPFWARLAEFPVSHVVVETAFSEPEAALAGASGHHCPSSLAAELAGAPADARLYITHIKPGEIDAVMAGLRARNQDRPLMELLKGDVFEF